MPANNIFDEWLIFEGRFYLENHHYKLCIKSVTLKSASDFQWASFMVYLEVS